VLLPCNVFDNLAARPNNSHQSSPKLDVYLKRLTVCNKQDHKHSAALSTEDQEAEEESDEPTAPKRNRRDAESAPPEDVEKPYLRVKLNFAINARAEQIKDFRKLTLEKLFATELPEKLSSLNSPYVGLFTSSLNISLTNVTSTKTGPSGTEEKKGFVEITLPSRSVFGLSSRALLQSLNIAVDAWNYTVPPALANANTDYKWILVANNTAEDIIFRSTTAVPVNIIAGALGTNIPTSLGIFFHRLATNLVTKTSFNENQLLPADYSFLSVMLIKITKRIVSLADIDMRHFDAVILSSPEESLVLKKITRHTENLPPNQNITLTYTWSDACAKALGLTKNEIVWQLSASDEVQPVITFDTEAISRHNAMNQTELRATRTRLMQKYAAAQDLVWTHDMASPIMGLNIETIKKLSKKLPPQPPPLSPPLLHKQPKLLKLNNKSTPS